MIKNAVRLFWILVLILVVLGGSFGYEAFLRRPKPETSDTTFEITNGETAKDVGKRLEEQKIISSALWFDWFVRLIDAETRFQAGSFTLQPGMSYAALVAALVDAGSKEIQVTIPEGYTLKQIGEAVRQGLPHITEKEWQQATGSNSPLKKTKPILNQIPPSLDLEGYLFPDTYRFAARAAAEEVAGVMVNTLQRRLREADYLLGDDPTKEELKLHDMLTLASIVEREVRSREDMENVADIFFKRLDAGISLQADSTVNYVTGGTRPSITFEETKLDSPYNTYRYPGLPPGPISNPGMNAILAIFHPADNPWYYFLTTDDGRVIYARTFAEHSANKQKYLR